MKVVQINANADYGSTGLVVQGIHNCLEREGIDSIIVYQRCKKRPIKGYQVGNIIDWKLHAIMTRLFGHYGFYSKLATKCLLRYLDREKPDIVHLHNVHSNYVNIKILLEYLSSNDIPTVLTLHDCWFFTGKCFHYVDQSCNKFINGCQICPKRYLPPIYYLNDTSNYDWEKKKELLDNIRRLYVVGCSKWIANEAAKSFLKIHPINYIYNGVDTTIFYPRISTLRRSNHISEESFVILGMANKWFLERNLGIVNKLVNIDGIVIIILGCTKQQLELQSEMPPHVILKGFIVNREELAEYYSISNVFINLTHADTLPTVNMESICCGTPVITYDVGGSPEMIYDSTGIVVKEDDENGIVDAIQQVRRKQFSECSNIGVIKFSQEKSFSYYLDLYKQILE